MLKKIMTASGVLLCANLALAAMPSSPVLVGQDDLVRAHHNEVAAQVITAVDMSIDHARIKENETGVFMQLKNNGRYQHRVIAAYSPIAGRVELHKTELKSGKHQMVQVWSIVIPPHQADELRPGSFHVMLIDLKQPLVVKQGVPLVILFADGSSLSVSVPVV